MGLHGVSLVCIVLLPIISILAMIFRDIDHNEFASESDPIIETNSLEYKKEEIKMMGIGTFEEMMTEFKESLKKALIAEAGNTGTAMNSRNKPWLRISERYLRRLWRN